MNNLWTAKSAALFGIAGACVLGLAACQNEPAPTPGQSTESVEPAEAGPDAKPGISADSGKLVLPVIAGRPGAVYFTVRNRGAEVATLAGVDLTGAKRADMHKTDGGAMDAVKELRLEPGAEVKFAPGGLHVMAFDIDPALKAGGTSELTLTFADGDKVSIPVAISAMGAGADDHAMEGMTH